MIDHSVNIDGVYKTEFRMPFHDFAQNNEKLHCYLLVHGVIMGVKHVFKHVGKPHFSAEKVQVILSEIDCAIFYTNLQELFCQFIS